MRRFKDFWANYFLPWGILIENILWKKQKNKKREQSLQNSILEKLRSCFLLDLLRFCVKSKGKLALSKTDLLVFLLKGAVFFAKTIFLWFLNLNWKQLQWGGSCFGPEQHKKRFLLWRDGKGGSKGIDYTTLRFKV